MRRILRTSTAVVMCLSLIAPQIAVAQGQGGQPQDQIVLPKRKDEQPKKAEAQREKPNAPKAAPKKQAEQPQRQQKQPAQAQKPQPKKPQQQKAEHQQAPKAQQKPAPRAQKQGEAPRKPERAQADNPQRIQQPGAKPDAQRKAVQAEPQRKPQPEQKRQQKPGGEQAQQPRKQPAQPDADALRKAMQNKEQPGRAPQRNVEKPNPQDPGRQGGNPPKPNPQADNNRAKLPQPGAAERGPAPNQLTADQLRESKGGVRLPAPEAKVKPNDVAKRAAQANKLPPAAALAAAGGNAAKGKVTETKITRENARRSDEDFRTRVGDGERRDDRQRPRNNEEMRRELERREQNLSDAERRADRRERELDQQRDWDRRHDRDRDRRDEARDDDDDNKSDIAKLLLAGAAGFAVGKIMSNNRQVALNTGDRVVMTLPDGSQQVVRDDNALLYRPGSDVSTETFQDGSTRSTVLRADGSRVVTIRDADLNVLRRTLIRPDGSETRLINDTVAQPVQVSSLPAPQPVEYNRTPLPEAELRQALLRESSVDRRFTLGQIRDIPEVRSLVAPVNVPEITFDSGSAALSSDQAEQLSTLGKVISDSIAQNPNEMFMIEGYTDATGSTATNLALSDRRAESVALALTEYFDVPPENMVVQGYGEQFLLVPSEQDERDNRRVAVRRITDLLEQS